MGSWSSLLTKLLLKIMNSVAMWKYMPRYIQFSCHLPFILQRLLKQKQQFSHGPELFNKASVRFTVILSPFYLLLVFCPMNNRIPAISRLNSKRQKKCRNLANMLCTRRLSSFVFHFILIIVWSLNLICQSSLAGWRSLLQGLCRITQEALRAGLHAPSLCLLVQIQK